MFRRHGATTGEHLADRLRNHSSCDRTAVVGVSGRVALQAGETWLNARIVFTFRGDDPAAGGDADDGVVDARGGITEVRLARTAAAPSPAPTGGSRRR